MFKWKYKIFEILYNNKTTEDNEANNNNNNYFPIIYINYFVATV